ncbi:ribonuclease Y [bacterium]|nr:ribonuclease Y [bacterium]
MDIVFIIVALAGGAGAGYGTKHVLSKKKSQNAEAKASKLVEEAKAKAKEVELAAKEAAIKMADEAKKEDKERRERLEAQEKRLAEREKMLDNKLDSLERKTESLHENEKEIDAIKEELKSIRVRQQENLEKIAKLKKEEAQEKLMQMTEKDIKADLVSLIAKRKDEAKEKADEYARELLADAMARMATEASGERTITTVKIPDDEMKGRIIGKEGRNIQTIERMTGVDVLIDETPGVITLSSFDPIRRQVARVAIETLVKDGRVHPARIEEVVKKAEKEIDAEIKKAGEDAAREAKVLGLPAEINKTMGMLKFRTSYSQNVLHHSIEMAHLGAMLAAEIGANVQVTRAASYLHDLGKAVSHEVDGNHHHITGEMLRKYGIDEAIAHAAEAHHDDIEATTPEAMIVRAVDGLSGGRPGARGDTLERFADRMKDLENLVNSFDGIEKTFAMSAGREIRVFVRPQHVDDLSAIKMARDIANKIEATLKYPGTIKVNVIRETRAEEYAK